MKIWIINQFALKKNQAGIARHHLLAIEMAKKGHDVTIIASAFDYLNHKESHLASGEVVKFEEVEKVNFIWLKTGKYQKNGFKKILSWLEFAVKVLSLPKIQKEKPDIIIGSSPQILSAFSAKILSRNMKIPFVLEIRDLWPQSLIDLGGFSKKHPAVIVLSWIERYLYKNSNHIISVLPNTSLYMKERGANIEKITFIPNGIDMDMLSNIDLKKLRDPNKNKDIFMYSGAHGIANGLENIINAALILKNQEYHEIEIQFIGNGSIKKDLIKMAKTLNLDNIKFVSAMPREDLYKYMQNADFFIMPLKDSPVFRFGISPNKLFDYLIIGKPILFAVNSYNNPIKESKSGVTANPGSAEDIAEKMIYLSRLNISQREEMGRCGRIYVEKFHDLKILASKLEVVILNVLENQKQS